MYICIYCNRRFYTRFGRDEHQKFCNSKIHHEPSPAAYRDEDEDSSISSPIFSKSILDDFKGEEVEEVTGKGGGFGGGGASTDWDESSSLSNDDTPSTSNDD